MLENSVWRQYHDELNISKFLKPLYSKWEMELIEDEIALHNILKAKLTKKEFRLFAMECAKVDERKMCERFGIELKELEQMKQKLYKKLIQDKVRLAFRKSKELE